MRMMLHIYIGFNHNSIVFHHLHHHNSIVFHHHHHHNSIVFHHHHHNSIVFHHHHHHSSIVFHHYLLFYHHIENHIKHDTGVSGCHLNLVKCCLHFIFVRAEQQTFKRDEETLHPESQIVRRILFKPS